MIFITLKNKEQKAFKWRWTSWWGICLLVWVIQRQQLQLQQAQLLDSDDALVTEAVVEEDPLCHLLKT